MFLLHFLSAVIKPLKHSHVSQTHPAIVDGHKPHCIQVRFHNHDEIELGKVIGRNTSVYELELG